MQHVGDSAAWWNAFGATAAISLIPNLILFAIPTTLLLKDNGSRINYQHILLCFASGALLGALLNNLLANSQFRSSEICSRLKWELSSDF